MEAKKYCYIRIEGSDNGGAVLNYDEKVKNGQGVYDNWTTIPRTLTYSSSELPSMMAKVTEMLSSKVEMKEMEKGEKEEKEEEGGEIEISIKPKSSY